MTSKLKIFCILILNLTYSDFSKGQTSIYHPFPDSSAMWRVDEIDSSIPFGSGYSYYQIYIEGDTIASNGMIYHKLFIEGDFNVNLPIYNFGKGLFGVLWQDTVNRKVYYKEINLINCFTCDSLLYDFNMQIGDPLTNSIYFTQGGATMTIYSIDSIYINGSYRKKFNLAYFDMTPTGEYIIEGIGSTLGGFFQYETFEQYRHLVCFEQNDTTIYPFGHGPCLPITASNNEVITEEKKVKIYPVPLRNELFIESNEIIKEIKIINFLGVELRDIQFEIMDEKVRIFNIDIPTGNYIIILNSNSNKTTKIITVIGSE